MKKLSLLFAASATLLIMTSCLGDNDPHNAGFVFRKPTRVVNTFYANNLVDTISFMSYGNWALTRTDNSTWCDIATTSGHGSTLYTFPVTFQQNLTGQGRAAQFKFIDTDYPDEASAALLYWQYATRGDGTLGSAPDVKAISGTDGSRFTFEYDAQHRPKSLRITKDDVLIRSLTLQFNDYDSLLTVQDMSKTLTGHYSYDYQPQRLVGTGDTICYSSQYYNNGIPVSANYAFNLEHRTINGNNTYHAFLLGGQSLMADSLHCADSLRIATTSAVGTQVAKYKLEYHPMDNRHQSVDVNQLILGTQQCDPYQLLSLFRYARHTSIISAIKDQNRSWLTAVQLNADQSVHQLTVTTANSAEQPIVYTFEY